ncbi:MAG TPA: PDZ domain-containing protein [Gemmatimonadales bacterium]|nr:PDZ domain-containing protein [Gemmatimonadales bacterium]
MRLRIPTAVSLVLVAVTSAAPLWAQGTPAPRAQTRSPRADSAYAAAARDSARANFDTLRRRSYFFRDSMQPMMAQAFGIRRVRIGVVVNTRPSDSDSIGALLDAVTPGGPAATAGLQAGDIITQFGGTPLAVKISAVPPGTKVPNPGFRLVELVAKLQPNDTVTVQYRRGKARKSARVVTAAEPDNLTVVIGPDGNYGWRAIPDGEAYWVGGEGDNERALEMAMRRSEIARGSLRSPEPPFAPRMSGAMLDLELAPVNPQLGSYFGTTEGVLVVDVPDPAPLGLKAGDVVLSVDGRKVSGPGQLMRILGSYDSDEPIGLEVMRQKKRVALKGTLGG